MIKKINQTNKQTKRQKTKQNKTKQSKASKAKQSKAKQSKAKQSKAKQSKTKQNKTKQNKTKQNKNKTKTEKKKRKGPVPLTCGWLHYFSPCNNPPLSKWLRLKWQVAQSFHQARSHDLFWKGVGPPQKQWTFWTKKLCELTFQGP